MAAARVKVYGKKTLDGQIRGIRLQPRCLHEERERLIARIERAADHQCALREENARRRLVIVQKLCLVQTRINIQTRIVKIRNFQQFHDGFRTSPYYAGPEKKSRIRPLQSFVSS